MYMLPHVVKMCQCKPFLMILDVKNLLALKWDEVTFFTSSNAVHSPENLKRDSRRNLYCKHANNWICMKDNTCLPVIKNIFWHWTCSLDLNIFSLRHSKGFFSCFWFVSFRSNMCDDTFPKMSILTSNILRLKQCLKACLPDYFH